MLPLLVARAHPEVCRPRSNHRACRSAAALHVKRGVLLKRIAKGSIADKAKLYPGDTIVGVNGKLVNHHSEAVRELGLTQCHCTPLPTVHGSRVCTPLTVARVHGPCACR